MFGTRVRSSLVLGLGLGLGCEVTETREIPLDDAYEVLRGALCERASRCQCDRWSAYDSVDECEEDVGEAVDRLRDLEVSMSYDPSCMGRYVDQLDELGCSPVFEEPEACVRPCLLMHGDLLEGEPCFVYSSWVSDCAQGLQCQGECVDPCREQDPPVRAGLGESCAQIGCDDDLRCGESQVCEALPVAGQECTGRCAEGLFCEAEDPIDPMSIMRCFAPRGLDAPCRGHAQCDSGYCPAGACALLPREGESCADARACAVGLDCIDDVCGPADAVLCSVSVPSF